ncbi:7731_t:CDS:1 [Paraglomus brasilianum]|uniref:7731_t:CDS:1 n=1 Tax=Paraglomus brasilianum TaxID=144538 RepID=A0A9N8WI61_9GLOM|nr:7731_t:CDS:1 [Paraglomus brasilianum]
MKSVYFLSLLAALIFTDPTPANAAPLEKCCPISRCVFTQGDVPVNSPGFTGNTFNGYLQFVQSPKTVLQIDGFINIEGAINGAIDGTFDLHVANCSTASTEQPGDPATIDLDSESFNTPILTSRSLSINKIAGQCCFVVEEFASIGGSVPRNERILGVASVETVIDCVNTTNSVAPTTTATSSTAETS